MYTVRSRLANRICLIFGQYLKRAQCFVCNINYYALPLKCFNLATGYISKNHEIFSIISKWNKNVLKKQLHCIDVGFFILQFRIQLQD